MGKAKKKPKTDQRSVKQKPKAKKVQQQIAKNTKVVKKTDYRSVYLLNEKEIELGGGAEQEVTERLDGKAAEKPAGRQDDEKSEAAAVIEATAAAEDDVKEADAAGTTEELCEEEPENGALGELDKEQEGALEKSEWSEKSEASSRRKLGVAERLHALNIDYPWLKIVGVVILILLVIGGVVMALQSKDVVSGGETGVNTEIDEQQTTPEEPVEDEQPGQTENKDSAAEPGQNTDTTPAQPEVNVAPGSKLIALTFDDGPSGATTPRLLDILAQKQVKATFFVLGSMAQRAPEIVKRAEVEGHEVGSHTPWHDNLVKLSAAEIQAQAATMKQMMTEILGHGPKLTRPPYGSVDQKVRDNLGQPLIIWSIDPEDWKYRDAATVRANVVNNAFDGAIILMHDIYGSTVDAVAGIIDDLRAQGYEFLTISELAQTRGESLVNGTSYYYFKP